MKNATKNGGYLVAIHDFTVYIINSKFKKASKTMCH